MDCLAARLQANGFFLSHCHDGGWRPPAKRVHHVEQYFRDRGWRVWENGPGDEFDDGGRVAYLQLSTG